MKKLKSLLIFLLISSHASEYSAHQYHYVDRITLSQCVEDAQKAFRQNGFTNINIHWDKKYPYAGISARNSEGYTAQYLCESHKGFAYLIVNGPRSDQKYRLRDKLGEDIKKLHKQH